MRDFCLGSCFIRKGIVKKDFGSFLASEARRWITPLFITVGLLLCHSNAVAQVVATDQSDYSPGSTANISGSGFASGETIQLQVINLSDPSDNGPEHNPWTVTAASDGSFTTSWYVTPDEVGATLQLTATGLSSGLIAQTNFMDGAPASGSGTMTTAPATATAGTATNSFVFTFTQTGNGANGSWGSGSYATLSIPAGWTAPQTSSSSAAGYIQASPQGSSTASIASVSGSGPWTVTINMTTPNSGGSWALTYTNVTAPTTPASYIFTNATHESSGGTPVNISSQPTVTVNPGAPSKLVFTANPSNIVAGSVISQTKVQVQDAYGNFISTNGIPVTVTLNTNSFSTGTNRVATDSTGQASFTNLVITAAANGYTMTGSASNLTSAVSTSFNVTPASASVTNTVITASPTSIVANGSSTSAITVTEKDAYGNSLTSSGVTPVLSTSRGTLGSVTDNHNGTYSATLTSSTAVGTASITGTLSSVTISNSATVVMTASSTVSMVSSANPALVGTNVVFTATVSAVSPSTGTPTGTVQFQTNGVNFGSPVTLSGGSATSGAFSTTLAGTYTVTASYSGDGFFNSSSGTLSGGQVVLKYSSGTTVISPIANPSKYGQTVTFTATISGSGATPTGTVQFQTNGVNFGSAATLSGGSAASGALPTTLPPGTYTITANYGGDANYNTSSGTLSGGQVVQKSSTTSTVTSPIANPSKYGQSGVTFSVAVSATSPGNGTPTGTVQFQTNGVNFGSAVTLSGGSATSGALPTILPPGTYTVTANYSGDGNFNTNSGTLSGGQVVQKSVTSTTVTSPVANPSKYGQSGITFAAAVSATSPGSGTPTGTVQFQTNGVNFGSAVTLSGGSATSGALPLTLPAGSYSVTAVYNGDGNFNTSTSITLTQTINKASSSTSVSSSLNPAGSGTNVVFTATLSAVSPGSGTPTGSVHFLTNGVLGSTITLSLGSAGYTNSTLPHATNTVTATYGGDINFLGSTNSLSEVINSAPVAGIANYSRPTNVTLLIKISSLLTNASDPDGDAITLVGTSAHSTNNATLLIEGSYVAYKPPTTNGNVTDTFNYFVQDSFGATNIGLVVVTIQGTTPTAQSMNITGMGTTNGVTTINFAGIPGYQYYVQASTNLTSWVTISTNSAGTNGLFQFLDTQASNYPVRYYRTAWH